ncbi:hypothetical protein [Chitinophaga sp. sic0106]|uniref:hypothetical protein n=1 Tax=Chitinophaga sp. sic0106 TaxID=2854785 RepID=UPI001C4770EC|nr:hypothetical protein [Chitinophaga sp. sic0106]MBV7530456.1 hypothetical protein [Chitinophaga sp. sic0106]
MKGFITLYAFSVAVMMGCNQPQTKAAHELWFRQTKERIISQASAEPDSVHFSYNRDSSTKIQQSFANHQLLITRAYDNNVLHYEFYHSKDGAFELRREFTFKGPASFEGIYYRGEGYGLSTWLRTENQVEAQGVRVNGKKVGKWKEWNAATGKLTEADYGGEATIESFPILKKM